jgi:hypothetical protein
MRELFAYEDLICWSSSRKKTVYLQYEAAPEKISNSAAFDQRLRNESLSSIADERVICFLMKSNVISNSDTYKKRPVYTDLFYFARLERFELPTYGFVVRRSIQLSYRRVIS